MTQSDLGVTSRGNEWHTQHKSSTQPVTVKTLTLRPREVREKVKIR